MLCVGEEYVQSDLPNTCPVNCNTGKVCAEHRRNVLTMIEQMICISIQCTDSTSLTAFLHPVHLTPRSKLSHQQLILHTTLLASSLSHSFERAVRHAKPDDTSSIGSVG